MTSMDSLPEITPRTETPPHLRTGNINIPPLDAKRGPSDLDKETDWGVDEALGASLNTLRTHIEGNELLSEFTPVLDAAFATELVLLDAEGNPVDHVYMEPGDDFDLCMLDFDGVLNERKGGFSQVMFKGVGGWHLLDQDRRKTKLDPEVLQAVLKKISN